MQPSGRQIERVYAVDEVPAPTGPFAWASGWDQLVVAAARGIDVATRQPAETDAQRVHLIFSHLQKILAASGSSLSRVLAAHVYVTNMDHHRPLVYEAFAHFFGSELPACTMVEVSALNQSDTIEIEVVAARADRS